MLGSCWDHFRIILGLFLDGFTNIPSNGPKLAANQLALNETKVREPRTTGEKKRKKLTATANREEVRGPRAALVTPN